MVVRKGPQKAEPKKKMKFRHKPHSKAKTKNHKKHACICSDSRGWCKEASAFFSATNDTLGGSFGITKTKDPGRDRTTVIKQIQRHLRADVTKWDNLGEVHIAKHHYSRKQVQFMSEDRRSRYVTKLYTRKELKGVCGDLRDADRIDGHKWIIPPSQTKSNVLQLMKDDRVIPDMKAEGGYCNNGGSLTPEGSRVSPKIRGAVRRSRDVAYGIDIMESEEAAIYGFQGDDDCLDAEEGIESSEDEGDDEEDDTTFNQIDQAENALAVRWNLWKDEYHERFPEKSKQLFGVEWKLLKIVFEAMWPELEFTGCEKNCFQNPLTEFESLLITAHFFRTGYTYTELNNTWYVSRKKISAAIKACSPKLAELGQMMYDVPLDKAIIKAMIPEKYPESLEPVGALVDGKVFQCEVFSRNNKIRQHMYNHKTNGNGVMGLVWSLGCGFVVAATPLYLGRTSEKSAVFHYGSASKCITDLKD